MPAFADKEELLTFFYSFSIRPIVFVPRLLYYCLLLCSFDFVCSESFKFLSYFLLCIFYSHLICAYHGDFNDTLKL